MFVCVSVGVHAAHKSGGDKARHIFLGGGGHNKNARAHPRQNRIASQSLTTSHAGITFQIVEHGRLYGLASVIPRTSVPPTHNTDRRCDFDYDMSATNAK